jgi:hypothetical protein
VVAQREIRLHPGKLQGFSQANSRQNRGWLVEDVLSLKDIPQLVDFFTTWIGLTPEDAPVLIRDRSVQEIYALDLQ